MNEENTVTAAGHILHKKNKQMELQCYRSIMKTVCDIIFSYGVNTLE